MKPGVSQDPVFRSADSFGACGMRKEGWRSHRSGYMVAGACERLSKSSRERGNGKGRSKGVGVEVGVSIIEHLISIVRLWDWRGLGGQPVGLPHSTLATCGRGSLWRGSQ